MGTTSHIQTGTVDMPTKGLILTGVITIAVFSILCFIVVTDHILCSVGFILFFCMAATIVFIIMGPIFFSFSNWKLDESLGKSPMDMIQVDATIIAGILIFLTINAATNPNGIPIREVFDHSKITSLPERPLIAALATLTIIPFTLSSIILLIWGNELVRRSTRKPFHVMRSFTVQPHFDEQIVKLCKSHNVTGLKLGTTFTIAGFIWIILSMIIFVFIPL